MSERKLNAAFSIVCVALLTTVTGASADLGVGSADIYYHLLDRYCPNKHFRWLSNGDLSLAIKDFRDSLEPPLRGQMDAVADIETRCTQSFAKGFVGLDCQ